MNRRNLKNTPELIIETRAEEALLFDRYSQLLPKSQRQTLYLYLVEDLSVTEVAAELAMSRQGAQDSISKGINKLKAIDSKLGENAGE